jgi:hypothetical protein
MIKSLQKNEYLTKSKPKGINGKKKLKESNSAFDKGSKKSTMQKDITATRKHMKKMRKQKIC